MQAHRLLFPRPRSVRAGHGAVTLPTETALAGERVPPWLRRRFTRACAAAGVRLRARAQKAVALRIDGASFARVADAGLRAQSYRLRLSADGSALIEAGGAPGLQYGVVSLCLLLEAAAAGAALSPLTILDTPAFEVRGVQADLAREFFPPLGYLKRLVDRLADLKLNTLWLYLENHFHAPGMEDISPPGGLTPEQARAISAYAAERGIDVVPGTNLLSHMEGWFRLERHADLCDGSGRSYPVLTRPEALRLAKRYADELARAFPSKNFHAGLDELLFTGANPEAARAIERTGKALYYGRFARALIRHIQSKGKVVWLWDDMILGKNVHRKEGFNDDAPKALACIAEDTVLVHWYYWTDADGKHSPIIRRVGESGRRFVVAPSVCTYKDDYGSLRTASENQIYMARCGLRHGAFGYVCTHWEARYGSSFEAGWPFLAMSADPAWSGGRRIDKAALHALSFVLTGETDGALARYLRSVCAIDELISARTRRSGGPVRSDLVLHGPHQLWRRLSPLLGPRDRAAVARLLEAASRQHAAIGPRDPALKECLLLPLDLFREGLTIIEALDNAWAEYHRAALIERDASRRGEFNLRIHKALTRLREAVGAVSRFRRRMLRLEATGHTPHDSYALAQHARNLLGVCDLIRRVARNGCGLPYFEKLLYLPDAYHLSSLSQLRVQNTFHQRHAGLPWPVRRGRLSPKRL